ncbi:ATPase [Thalassococcus sp. CAU 1522]|uniref:ATPase n=1 Tax=Thalassococcus arenae TaxID=2851652 RepID=A0ABS6N8X2_9RHOB|nr:BadF/BadG/BcrA/BcrD ATPase family protein [Thalassococcus arenae]MBV2360054.1 ATPase [Thalassococcus arenae]
MSGLLVGIDGGGTLCRAALQWNGGRAEVAVPGANAFSDPDGCIQAINAALGALAEKAAVDVAGLAGAPAYLALAGVTGPEIAERIAARLPLRRAVIEEDRRAALAGALNGADGAVAVCGTGSFVAFQQGGTVRFAGGYGLMLGDEASGAWLGRAAVSAVLAARDGIGPATALTEALQDSVGDSAALLDLGRSATPRDFGALAPRVTQAAGTGDKVALRLMQQGAGYIADCVMALGWRPGLRLCLAGGVGPRFALYLPELLREAVSPPDGTALDGALSLARQMAEAAE